MNSKRQIDQWRREADRTLAQLEREFPTASIIFIVSGANGVHWEVLFTEPRTPNPDPS